MPSCRAHIDQRLWLILRSPRRPALDHFPSVSLRGDVEGEGRPRRPCTFKYELDEMRTCMVDVSGRTEQVVLHQQALVPWQDHQVLPSLAARKVKRFDVRMGPGRTPESLSRTFKLFTFSARERTRVLSFENVLIRC